jgi:hypothetical protein
MTHRTDNDALQRLAVANVQYHLTRGNAQSTGEYFSSVSAGNTKEIYLENPTSDTYYGIIDSSIRSAGEVKVSKAFNVTEDTQGANPSTGITNKKSGGDGSTANARVGGDNETGVYSGGTSFNDKGAGSGSSEGESHPGDAGGAFDNIVDPGDNILLGVTNESGGSLSYISIDIDWVEIPQSDYP